MSLFRVFDIAGSAMTAQSVRLNTTASNLANAESATSSTGQPYRAKQVVFSAAQISPQAAGVKVAAISEDQSPARLVYAPQNPLADATGYIAMPNVNVVEEMTNMISASRSYQTNADMMNTAKTLLQRTLQLGTV
ncbi:flagellar basal body rod protein FlgC [Chitinimonas sp. BJB300]|uniref:flagellar basal body rod protein FlgC n=1 Tax=Chitinimonas sp. BJB300 TaxID=1559339 RepID=UPI000C0CFB50|nr:flagellar basal body rod protein FlgC [Chitinimonas sp. BJB300]PHV11234.1 flagellar basal body rod protein FlgC [Chitinimonas sp. BJB300]TSJ88621.1 flagellar basal body rod protein FlgC [Chitinimonas sp. BJB300]